jgi:hypothetical protein
MSFHPITIGSLTYNQAGNDGQYMLSTVNFGDPKHYIKVTGGKKGKSGVTTGGVSYVVEKDVTIDGVVKRRKFLYQGVIQAEDGFTPTEMDTYIQLTSDFITAATINRIMNGDF